MAGPFVDSQQSVLQLSSLDDDLLDEEEQGAGSPRYAPRSPTPLEEGESVTDDISKDSAFGVNNSGIEYSPRSPSPPPLQPIGRAPSGSSRRDRRNRRPPPMRSRDKRPSSDSSSFKKKYPVSKREAPSEPPIRKTFHDGRRRRPDFSRWSKPRPEALATERPRWPYKSEVIRHRNLAAVLAVDGNGYTLSNGVESWCHDNVRDWEDVAARVDRMGVLDLYLVDRETERRWWSLLSRGHTVRVSTLNNDGSVLGECHYCRDSDCHRWKAIVGGIAHLYKRSIEPIPHNPWWW